MVAHYGKGNSDCLLKLHLTMPFWKLEIQDYRFILLWQSTNGIKEL